MQNNKAKTALEFVERIAASGASATDVHNAFFGIGGKFAELFPSRAEREAFLKTSEFREIKRIRQALRAREQRAVSPS